MPSNTPSRAHHEYGGQIPLASAGQHVNTNAGPTLVSPQLAVNDKAAADTDGDFLARHSASLNVAPSSLTEGTFVVVAVPQPQQRRDDEHSSLRDDVVFRVAKIVGKIKSGEQRDDGEEKEDHHRSHTRHHQMARDAKRARRKKRLQRRQHHDTTNSQEECDAGHDEPTVDVIFYDVYGLSSDMLRAYALLQETAGHLRATAAPVFPAPSTTLSSSSQQQQQPMANIHEMLMSMGPQALGMSVAAMSFAPLHQQQHNNGNASSNMVTSSSNLRSLIGGVPQQQMHTPSRPTHQQPPSTGSGGGFLTASSNTARQRRVSMSAGANRSAASNAGGINNNLIGSDMFGFGGAAATPMNGPPTGGNLFSASVSPFATPFASPLGGGAGAVTPRALASTARGARNEPTANATAAALLPPIPLLPSERDKDGSAFVFTLRNRHSYLVEQMAFEVSVCDFLAQYERSLLRQQRIRDGSLDPRAAAEEEGGAVAVGRGARKGGGGGGNKSNISKRPLSAQAATMRKDSAADPSAAAAGGGDEEDNDDNDDPIRRDSHGITLDLANFRFGDPDDGIGGASVSSGNGGAAGRTGSGRSPHKSVSPLKAMMRPRRSARGSSANDRHSVGNGLIGQGKSPRKRFASFASDVSPPNTSSAPPSPGAMSASQMNVVGLGATDDTVAVVDQPPLPTAAVGSSIMCPPQRGSVDAFAAPSDAPAVTSTAAAVTLPSIPFVAEEVPPIISSGLAIGASPARRQLFTGDVPTRDAMHRHFNRPEEPLAPPSVSGVKNSSGNATHPLSIPSAHLSPSVSSTASPTIPQRHLSYSKALTFGTAAPATGDACAAGSPLSRQMSTMQTVVSVSASLQGSLSFASLKGGGGAWRRRDLSPPQQEHDGGLRSPDQQQPPPSMLVPTHPTTATTGPTPAAAIAPQRVTFPSNPNAPRITHDYFVLLPSMGDNDDGDVNDGGGANNQQQQSDALAAMAMAGAFSNNGNAGDATPLPASATRAFNPSASFAPTLLTVGSGSTINNTNAVNTSSGSSTRLSPSSPSSGVGGGAHSTSTTALHHAPNAASGGGGGAFGSNPLSGGGGAPPPQGTAAPSPPPPATTPAMRASATIALLDGGGATGTSGGASTAVPAVAKDAFGMPRDAWVPFARHLYTSSATTGSGSGSAHAALDAAVLRAYHNDPFTAAMVLSQMGCDGAYAAAPAGFVATLPQSSFYQFGQGSSVNMLNSTIAGGGGGVGHQLLSPFSSPLAAPGSGTAFNYQQQFAVPPPRLVVSTPQSAAAPTTTSNNAMQGGNGGGELPLFSQSTSTTAGGGGGGGGASALFSNTMYLAAVPPPPQPLAPPEAPVPRPRSVQVRHIIMAGLPMLEHTMTFRGDQFRETDRQTAMGAAMASAAYGGGGMLGIDKSYLPGGANYVVTGAANSGATDAKGGAGQGAVKHQSHANLRAPHLMGASASSPSRSFSRRLTTWLGQATSNSGPSAHRSSAVPNENDNTGRQRTSMLVPRAPTTTANSGGGVGPSANAAATTAKNNGDPSAAAGGSGGLNPSGGATNGPSRVFRSYVQLAAFLDARIVATFRAAYHAQCAVRSAARIAAEKEERQQATVDDSDPLFVTNIAESSSDSVCSDDNASVADEAIDGAPMRSSGSDATQRPSTDSGTTGTAHPPGSSSSTTARGSTVSTYSHNINTSNRSSVKYRNTRIGSTVDGSELVLGVGDEEDEVSTPLHPDGGKGDFGTGIGRFSATQSPVTTSIIGRVRTASSSEGLRLHHEVPPLGGIAASVLTPTSASRRAGSSVVITVQDDEDSSRCGGRGAGDGDRRLTCTSTVGDTAAASASHSSGSVLASSLEPSIKEASTINAKLAPGRMKKGSSSAKGSTPPHGPSPSMPTASLRVGDVTWTPMPLRERGEEGAVSGPAGGGVRVTLHRITREAIAQLSSDAPIPIPFALTTKSDASASSPSKDLAIRELYAHFLSFDTSDALLEELAAIVAVKLPLLSAFALVHDDASDVLPVGVNALTEKPPFVPMALLTGRQTGAVVPLGSPAPSACGPTSPNRAKLLLEGAGPSDGRKVVIGSLGRPIPDCKHARGTAAHHAGDSTVVVGTPGAEGRSTSTQGPSAAAIVGSALVPMLSSGSPPRQLLGSSKVASHRSPYHVTIAGEVPFYTPADQRGKRDSRGAVYPLTAAAAPEMDRPDAPTGDESGAHHHATGTIMVVSPPAHAKRPNTMAGTNASGGQSTFSRHSAVSALTVQKDPPPAAAPTDAAGKTSPTVGGMVRGAGSPLRITPPRSPTDAVPGRSGGRSVLVRREPLNYGRSYLAAGGGGASPQQHHQMSSSSTGYPALSTPPPTMNRGTLGMYTSITSPPPSSPSAADQAPAPATTLVLQDEHSAAVASVAAGDPSAVVEGRVSVSVGVQSLVNALYFRSMCRLELVEQYAVMDGPPIDDVNENGSGGKETIDWAPNSNNAPSSSSSIAKASPRYAAFFMPLESLAFVHCGLEDHNVSDLATIVPLARRASFSHNRLGKGFMDVFTRALEELAALCTASNDGGGGDVVLDLSRVASRGLAAVVGNILGVASAVTAHTSISTVVIAPLRIKELNVSNNSIADDGLHAFLDLVDCQRLRDRYASDYASPHHHHRPPPIPLRLFDVSFNRVSQSMRRDLAERLGKPLMATRGDGSKKKNAKKGQSGGSSSSGSKEGIALTHWSPQLQRRMPRAIDFFVTRQAITALMCFANRTVGGGALYRTVRTTSDVPSFLHYAGSVAAAVLGGEGSGSGGGSHQRSLERRQNALAILEQAASSSSQSQLTARHGNGRDFTIAMLILSFLPAKESPVHIIV